MQHFLTVKYDVSPGRRLPGHKNTTKQTVQRTTHLQKLKAHHTPVKAKATMAKRSARKYFYLFHNTYGFCNNLTHQLDVNFRKAAIMLKMLYM